MNIYQDDHSDIDNEIAEDPTASVVSGMFRATEDEIVPTEQLMQSLGEIGTDERWFEKKSAANSSRRYLAIVASIALLVVAFAAWQANETGQTESVEDNLTAQEIEDNNNNLERLETDDSDSQRNEDSVIGEPGVAEAYESDPNCAEVNTLPLGQSSLEAEPMGAIWCFSLGSDSAPTRNAGANTWQDDFDTNSSMQEFGDLDFDYRVFNQAGANPADQSQHFVNNNHLMLDSSGAFTGGSSFSPNRSFKFEDGKIVLEADISAGMADYGRDRWFEFVVTSAAEPNSIAAGNYSYGQFGDDWSAGCLLGSGGDSTCVVMAPEGQAIAPGCLNSEQRFLEVSDFKRCGDGPHSGGKRTATDPKFPGLTGADFWRQCSEGEERDQCQDRMRLEITESSMTLWVNGFKYFESSGWPENKQLPASFVEGDVYAYFSSWSYRSEKEGNVWRYHWDNVSVNPPSALTASPSFCAQNSELCSG